MRAVRRPRRECRALAVLPVQRSSSRGIRNRSGNGSESVHFSRFSPSQTHTEFSPAVATVRSQSLGISYGTGKSIENALNSFKPDGDPAWDAIDFAVFAARQ
jgi:hypothetical protein